MPSPVLTLPQSGTHGEACANAGNPRWPPPCLPMIPHPPSALAAPS